MADAKPFFAVIMAGGSGTRLWPLSRKSRPKQFHAFLSEKTMLQETFERVRSVVPNDHIYVSTGLDYCDLVLTQLPEIGPGQLIIEPEARNTGPAVSLVAAWITATFPDAIIATIASDHAIEDSEEFEGTLRAAFETIALHQDKLVVVGINPTAPDTGLGYIKLGKEFATVNERRVFVADSFKEKPDEATALAYLRSFDYLWNAGYFIFAGATLLSWLETMVPELHQTLAQIMAAEKNDSLDEKTLRELYAQTPLAPFDTLVVEKLESDKRLVIPSPIEWSDVGNWNTLYNFLKQEQKTDLVSMGKHIDLGSSGTLVHGGKRLITTMNLKDLVIIDSDDALLIADRRTSATTIKTLLEELKKENSDLL